VGPLVGHRDQHPQPAQAEAPPLPAQHPLAEHGRREQRDQHRVQPLHERHDSTGQPLADRDVGGAELQRLDQQAAHRDVPELPASGPAGAAQLRQPGQQHTGDGEPGEGQQQRRRRADPDHGDHEGAAPERHEQRPQYRVQPAPNRPAAGGTRSGRGGRFNQLNLVSRLSQGGPLRSSGSASPRNQLIGLRR